MGRQGFVGVMAGEENQSLPPMEKGSDQHGPVNEAASTDMEPVRLLCLRRLFFIPKGYTRLGFRSECCEYESVYGYLAALTESEHSAHTVRHNVHCFLFELFEMITITVVVP